MTQQYHRLKDGSGVVVRPIRIDDAVSNAAFVEALSPPSKHFLFLGGVPRLSAQALQRLCEPQEGRDMAFVAFPSDDAERQIGVARYAGATPSAGAEISIAVADDWQHKGLGTFLLKQLIEHARAHGIVRLYSMDAANNARMRTLAKHFGFTESADPKDIRQVIYSLEIAPEARAADIPVQAA